MKRFLIFVGVVFMLVLASCEIEGPFSVIYHANAQGTTGFVTDPKEYMPGDIATVLPNNFDYPGHTFKHWNTTPTDTGGTYQPGKKIDITNMTVNLYAIWESN